MEKKILSHANLVDEARTFCTSSHLYPELYGVTDGKAVGTFMERRFQEQIQANYITEIGNAALGLDLPAIETDIKVTSIRQPQSSCPFRSARQKIYGLGYNLLVFVYEKEDAQASQTAQLSFVSCAFIEKNRTADYLTTRGILRILEHEGNRDDLFAFLSDRNLPGDEIVYYSLADEILQTPPQLGYLTISNALQWRLQYGRIVQLQESVSGIVKIV